MSEIMDWGDDMAAFNAWFEENGGWSRLPGVGRNYRGNKADMNLGHEHLLRRTDGPGTVVPGWDGWHYGGMDPGLFPLADRR